MAQESETALYRIEMQLAREPGHPGGDPAERYILVAPLAKDGRLDGASWRFVKDRCRVVKEAPGDEPRTGRLVHGPGGRWFFDYADQIPPERGFRFESERFITGEYVSVRIADQTHPFQIIRAARL